MIIGFIVTCVFVHYLWFASFHTLAHVSYTESKTKIQIKRKNIVSGESTYSVWRGIGKTHGQFI